LNIIRSHPPRQAAGNALAAGFKLPLRRAPPLWYRRCIFPAGVEVPQMREILGKIHAHVPIRLLAGKVLPLVLRERIRPEIGISHIALDEIAREEFLRVADILRQEGLPVTIHAPFMDLRPGALDPRIRQVSSDRIGQALALAAYFRPRSVVCHASFDERYYVSAEEQWLENSVETWRRLLPAAEDAGTVICLENVYEKEPLQIRRLLEAVASPRLRFCFDTGHFNIFASAPLEQWIDEMGPWLGHVHLHDNSGARDEHLPVGEGTFPFPEFFARLRERSLRPILTVESHSERDLWRMLDNLEARKLLDGWDEDGRS